MLTLEFTIQPVNLIQSIFAFTALFGSILIFGKKRFRGLVSFLFFTFSLMLFNFVEETDLFGPHFLITPAFTLAAGPCFYFFVFGAVGRSNALMVNITHLIPFCLGLIATDYLQPQTLIMYGTLSQIIYGVLSFKLLTRYHRFTLQTQSNALDLSLNWLMSVLVIFLLLGLTDLIRLNLQPAIGPEINNNWYFIHQCLALGLISYTIYKAVLTDIQVISIPSTDSAFTEQESIENSVQYQLNGEFNGESNGEIDEETVEELEQGYDLDNSKDPDQAFKLFNQVRTIVIDEELFLTPRFSLADLADRTGIHTKDLSWAINLGGKTNFNDLINLMRIDRCKVLLKEEKETPIIDIAFATGFNSKSSFNSVFKKHTGQTPRQFQVSDPESQA